jgi:hypothetical protein
VTQELNHKWRMHLQAAKPWLKLFYIWGMQWVLSGILDFFDNEQSILITIKLGVLLLAVLASLFTIIWNRSPLQSLHKPEKQDWRSYKSRQPIAMLTGSMLLLWYIAGSDPALILHVLQVLFLAFFYVLMGTFLGVELIGLGYWLFALTAIVSIWYLGFGPLVFDSMGGLSLIACGWILQGWSRKA